MKKIFICIFFCASLMAIISGCAKVQAEQSATKEFITTNCNASEEVEIVKRHILIEEGPIEANSERSQISIFYPEVIGLENCDVEHETNRILLSFCTTDAPYLEKNFLNELILGHVQFKAEMSYEVLFFSSSLLSVKFKEKISTNRVTINDYYITINLETGTEVSLFDVIDESTILENIIEGRYTIEEGSYLPGGWLGYEDNIKKDFYDILKNSTVNKVTCGINEIGVYICFDYEDSLNGYVTLFMQIRDGSFVPLLSQ